MIDLTDDIKYYIFYINVLGQGNSQDNNGNARIFAFRSYRCVRTPLELIFIFDGLTAFSIDRL